MITDLTISEVRELIQIESAHEKELLAIEMRYQEAKAQSVNDYHNAIEKMRHKVERRKREKRW